MKSLSLFTYCMFLIFTACNNHYTPKPRGYFEIEFPEHTYQSFNNPEFPFQFEYPVYANITRDSAHFEDGPDYPYWINIDYPGFNAKVYLSYKTIGGKSHFKVKTADGHKDSFALNTFENLREDAYKITYKHTSKASSIEDSVFITDKGTGAVIFSVGGNAATGKQFFITDTTRNFLRGALYFNETPNEDSLEIVYDFLQADMKHLINSLQWKSR